MWPRIGPSLLIQSWCVATVKSSWYFLFQHSIWTLSRFSCKKIRNIGCTWEELSYIPFVLKSSRGGCCYFHQLWVRHVLQTVLMKIFIFSFNLKSLINSLGQYWMENPWIFESYAYLLILWSWWHNFHQLSHFQYWWWTWTACRY